jgi:hypothetical protein
MKSLATKIMDTMYYVLAVLLAGVIADTIHIYYGHIVGGITIYSSYIDLWSYATKPLEALGVLIVYYFLGDRLYSKSRFLRGVQLAMLICLVKDGLLREPLMNTILGNPLLESIYRESQVWFSVLGMSLVISFMVTPKKCY